VAILGVLFFGEILTMIHWSLIIVMFVAGLFVSMDEHMRVRSFFSRRMMFGLLAILTSVGFNLAVKEASLHNGFWEVCLWSSVLTLIFISPTLLWCYRDLVKTKWSKYGGIVGSTIFSTAGLLTSFRALGQNVSISLAIMSVPLGMVLTMGLSLLFPKLLEKHTAKVYIIRLTAAAVMFAAALGLST
jgi:hypothetical protein